MPAFTLYLNVQNALSPAWKHFDIGLFKMFLCWFLGIFNTPKTKWNWLRINLSDARDQRRRFTCKLHANLRCNLCTTTFWEMFKTIHQRLSVNKFNKDELLWSRLECLHWKSHVKLGNYVLRRVTKLPSCRSDTCCFIGKKKTLWKHIEKTNKTNKGSHFSNY